MLLLLTAKINLFPFAGVKSSQDEVWLDRDPALAHAALLHGGGGRLEGRVLGAEQEVVQVCVVVTGVNIELVLAEFLEKV